MKAITQYLIGRGYECVPDDYYTRIELWNRWYRGKVPSFHNYYQYNGQKKVRRSRKTIGLGKTVSEDWANLLLNEKVQFTLES